MDLELAPFCFQYGIAIFLIPVKCKLKRSRKYQLKKEEFISQF